MPSKKTSTKKKKPASPKNITKKISTPDLTGTDAVHAQLQAWAHEGSKESLKKLADFIACEKNEDIRGYASIAHEEALFFYYSPNSEQEERDFLTAKMIRVKGDRLVDTMIKAEVARLELSKLDIDRQVHKRVLKQANTTQKEEWKYNFSEDYYTIIAHKLAEFEDEIAYASVWIEVAQKSIKTKKYTNVPIDVLEHIHLDGEDGSFWEDDDGCCGDWDEDAVFSPHCGSTHVEEIDDHVHPIGNYEDITIEDIPF